MTGEQIEENGKGVSLREHIIVWSVDAARCNVKLLIEDQEVPFNTTFCDHVDQLG